MPTPLYVGIDVSKAVLDVTLRPSGETLQVPRDDTGLATLVAHLQPRAPTLIVLEASGGYETPVVTALALAQLPLAVVHPRQVRAFARAIGRLAKTDALDAAVLALFAERVQPVPRPLPDADQQALAALVARRRQLIEMLTAERNRLPLASGRVRRDLLDHIHGLERRLQQTDRDIDTTVQQSPLWRTRDQLPQSVPGVGPITAAVLIADLPELGELPPRQLAALVGVAPLNCDSGQQRGGRTTWGGRAHVRRTLYMAARVAARHNPVLRAF